MALTLLDVFNQVDYLVNTNIGVSVFMQQYDEGSGNIAFEYDNVEFFMSLPEDTIVEPLIDGNILINGVEYKAYVAQQIKFEPTQD